MSLTFDAESAQKRVDRFWQLPASFGMESEMPTITILMRLSAIAMH